MTRWPLLRDVILFFAGLGLLANEALVRSGEPRLNLIVAYMTMMGLPAFLKKD